MPMTEWRYAERILHVDLTRQAALVLPTSLELKRAFVGGAGFVARLLADARRAGAGAPVVALATGPLSDEMAGRLALGATRSAVGPPALSSMGGRMAAALKSAGYDAVVISGQLAEPGCLVLNHDGVTILPAADLWGQEVPLAEAALTHKLGEGYASMVLGPAAENQVPFATMAHNGHFAGGSGVAVSLGAQRIKAIILPDHQAVPSRCTGCTLTCSSLPGENEARRAGALGLDAPTAARLAALARGCAEAGLLPPVGEPMDEIAHRTGIGRLLADGEAAVLSRLGPEAERIAAALPRAKRRNAPGVADLLGTCQRVLREHPGQVLREALSSTLGLLSSAV